MLPAPPPAVAGVLLPAVAGVGGGASGEVAMGDAPPPRSSWRGLEESIVETRRRPKEGRGGAEGGLAAGFTWADGAGGRRHRMGGGASPKGRDGAKEDITCNTDSEPPGTAQTQTKESKGKNRGGRCKREEQKGAMQRGWWAAGAREGRGRRCDGGEGAGGGRQ